MNVVGYIGYFTLFLGYSIAVAVAAVAVAAVAVAAVAAVSVGRKMTAFFKFIFHIFFRQT